VTTKPISKDRRRYPRVQVNWPVVILENDRAREGELREISLGGAFIRSDKPLNLKERSKLYIIVPNSKTFTVYFEVVWLRVDCSVGDIPPCGMGIRFTRVSSFDRQYLTEVISNYYQKKVARKSGKKKM
jgi:hypothetical protein